MSLRSHERSSEFCCIFIQVALQKQVSTRRTARSSSRFRNRPTTLSPSFRLKTRLGWSAVGQLNWESCRRILGADDRCETHRSEFLLFAVNSAQKTGSKKSPFTVCFHLRLQSPDREAPAQNLQD
ncbi:hypothetical protein AOLI_G00014180 [Acnodon oligacanthus]